MKGASTSEAIGGAGFGLQAGGAVGGAFSAYASAKAQKSNYQFQSNMAVYGANREAERASQAGAAGAQAKFKLNLNQAAGASDQRARLAAAGAALDEGSALRTMGDTKYISDLDNKQLTDNVDREVFMIREAARTEAFNASALKGGADQISPLAGGVAGALSGAGALASSWYKLNPQGSGGGKSSTPSTMTPAQELAAGVRAM